MKYIYLNIEIMYLIRSKNINSLYKINVNK